MYIGCIAVAVGVLCFSGDKVTCSDVPMVNIETCKCQSERMQLQQREAVRLGICSKDGSTCSGAPPMVAMTCK